MRTEEDIIKYIPSDPEVKKDDFAEIKYIVPDETFRPDFFIYVDFLRGVTINVGDLTPIERPDMADQLLASWEKFRSYLKTFPCDQVSRVQSLVSNNNLSKWGIQDAINIALNAFVESVNVTQNRTSPSTASIDLSPQMARRSARDANAGWADPLFFPIFQGNILHQLMIPHTFVYIYSRGRIMDDRYFPIFHGLINEVSFQNQAGIEKVSIECEDVCKLLRLSHINMSPALLDIAPDELDTKETNALGEIFLQRSAKEIVQEVVTRSTPGAKASKVGILDYQFTDLGKSNMPPDSTITPGERWAFPGIATDSRLGMRGQRQLYSWGIDASPFRQITGASIPTWASDLTFRYDLCQEIKKMMYAEFYADPCGNFHFHPMRTSQMYLVGSRIVPGGNTVEAEETGINGVYILGSEEMINSDFSVNDEGLCTFLGFSGKMEYVGDTSTEANAALLRRRIPGPKEFVGKYGMRYQTHSEPLVHEESALSKVGTAQFVFRNADHYNASITIIHRPEMRIARPVYLLDRAEVFYLNSINHQLTVGAVPITTLGLTYGRSITVPSIDFTSYLIEQGMSFDAMGAKTNEAINQLCEDGWIEQSRFLEKWLGNPKHKETA